MSKRFYVLFSLKQLFQPRLFKTRVTAQKYLKKNSLLEFRQFAQEQDAQAFFLEVEAETNRILRGEKEQDGEEKDREDNKGKAEEGRADCGGGQDMTSQTKDLEREEKDLRSEIYPIDLLAKEGEGLSKRAAQGIPTQSRNLDLEEEDEDEDKLSDSSEAEEEKTAVEAMSKDDILKEIMESISRMKQQLNAPPPKGRLPQQQQAVQSNAVRNRETAQDTDCSTKRLPVEEGEGQQPGQWSWLQLKNQKEERMQIQQQMQQEEDVQQSEEMMDQGVQQGHVHGGKESTHQAEAAVSGQEVKEESQEKRKTDNMNEQVSEQVVRVQKPPVIQFMQRKSTIHLLQRESSVEQEAEGYLEMEDKEVKETDEEPAAKAGALPQPPQPLEPQTSHNEAYLKEHSIKTQQFPQTKQMIRKEQLEMRQAKEIDEEQTRTARREEPLQRQPFLPFLPSESEITPTIHQSQHKQVVPLGDFDRIDYLDYSKEPPLSLRPISPYRVFLQSKLYEISNAAKATTTVAVKEGRLTISCRQNQNPGLSIAEYQLVTPSGTIQSVELLGVKPRAHAEALALRKGLELASLHKVKVVEVESDLKGTLRERESMLKGGECGLSMDRHLRKMKGPVLEAGLSFSRIYYL